MLLNKYIAEQLVSDRSRANTPRPCPPSVMLCLTPHTTSLSRKRGPHLQTSLFLVITIIHVIGEKNLQSSAFKTRDIPDYRIIDSGKICCSSVMPGFVLLGKTKQETSSSEAVQRFHKVMRVLSSCIIPLNFHPQHGLLIQHGYWSSAIAFI